MSRAHPPLLLFLILSLLIGACGQESEPARTPDGSQAQTEAQADGNQGHDHADHEDLPQNPGDQGSAVSEGDFDPTKQGRIWVQVLNEADQSPVVGCPVSLYWSRDGTAIGRVKSVTDQEGKSRFPLDERVFLDRIVAMGSPQTAPRALQLGKLMELGDHEPLLIYVKPAAIFSGTVKDEDGNPIPTAKIEAYVSDRWVIEGEKGAESISTGSTNADGAFRIGGMPEGPYLLTATAEGMMAVQRATGFNRYGEEVPNIEIVLSRSNLVSGEVLSESGQPVSQARVEAGAPKRRLTHTLTDDKRLVYLPARQWIVRSGSDGGFVLPAVPEGRPWKIRVSHQSFKDYFGPIEADTQVMKVYLNKGLEIHLQVRDTEGQPVRAADVVLLGRTRRALQLKGGELIMEGLEEDPDAILMVHSLGKAVKTIWPVAYNTVDDPLEVVLEPANPIIGQVVDGEANPISEVRIKVKGLDLFEPALLASYPGRLPERVFDFAERISDADGKFRIPGLYPGRFEVKAETPDGRVWEKVVEANTRDLAIVFD
jgi:protocatechuate 3,4-dioxygenase beta subunit